VHESLLSFSEESFNLLICKPTVKGLKDIILAVYDKEKDKVEMSKKN